MTNWSLNDLLVIKPIGKCYDTADSSMPNVYGARHSHFSEPH